MRVCRIAVFSLLGVAFFSGAGNAQSDCPTFPKVTFWGALSHSSVRQHVEDNLSGNWEAYLDQLRHQQKKLTDIYGRGSGAIIKRKNRRIKLAGEQLSKYLQFAKNRISVVQCLAELEDGTNLAEFSTAAGGDEQKEDLGLTADLDRTYITIPKSLLTKLRKLAVRKSLRETRKVSVSDIIVDILDRDLNRY